MQIETKFLSNNQYGVVAIVDKKYWHAVNQTGDKILENHVTININGVVKRIWIQK